MPSERWLRFALVVALLTAWIGCSRRSREHEVAYVSAPQAILRDQVANVYNKTGVVKNAEKVEVLERDRRFVRVHTDAGADGWMEQRYLVNQTVYDGFSKLAQQEQRAPVQATATTRNETNLHLTPARDAEHLYQLNEGAKISILKRATSERMLPGAAAPSATPAGKGKLNKQAPGPVMEDWWLMRDSQGHTGWVLARLVDVDAPLEIAQYAEGQRIVTSFVLNQVADGDKKVPQYLVLLTEPKDGMLFDYDQVRVFTWNVKRHRYETAYRERNLNGFLPVTVSQENFDKEGDLPVFALRVKDESGNQQEKKYKLDTPIVRRVYAPGEETEKTAGRKPASRKTIGRRERPKL
jgi:SH3-like domain-containing protein